VELSGADLIAPGGVSMGNLEVRSGTPQRRAPGGRLISAATIVAVLAVGGGWWSRDESNNVPDEGVGYALGIVGLSCMVVLLLYVVRKRARSLRGAGRITTWFQIHMILGLVGPVAILYHCNFHLGSLNSNVALVCALVVSASGVVGRLIYTRIHHGLSDRRATLEEVREDVLQARRAITGDRSQPQLWAILEEFENRVSRPKRHLLDAAWSFLVLGHSCRRAHARAMRNLRREGKRHPELATERRALRTQTRQFVAAVRRTETLGVYERVFALWHVLHLPLAFLLYVSAAVHVVAVNMY
jgi:hypothetical protein